tara:strand:+ start:563 stop:1360 length:798 start_codon:yes stop_codon:yes gene_type:complete
MKTYLFIDLSYFIFYLYYAKKKYLQCQKKYLQCQYLETTDLINNEYFMSLFNNFDKKLEEIKKKLKLKDNTEIIFAKDCKRNDIWRNELFPEYKKNRKVNNEVGEFFIHTYKNIIHKYNYINVDKCEADDIIGVLTKELYKDNKIYIITGDMDYLQLLYNENIQIYDLKYNNFREKSIGYKDDLLKKIILGDISDNIPSIHKKLGAKTVDKYLNNKEELQNKLKDPLIKQQFILNQKLIDMNFIPINFIKNILQIFKEKKYNNNI